MSDPVRLGVVGLGSMGRRHLESAALDARFSVTAVCDQDAGRAAAEAASVGAAGFDDTAKLIDSGVCDALLVATPHNRHVVCAAPALLAGLHVLVEKPVAVSVEGGRRLNAAFHEARKRHPSLVFAAMFQQRLMPVWREVKALVDAGTLGRLARVAWVVTDWLRSDAYYAAGGAGRWRGTWAGEGGGVLMNQAPHNLDLLLWLTGLTPARVTAVVGRGRRHRGVETEDEATATVEFAPRDDGPAATGVFVTATGEAPGTNRLELVGDRGTLTVEGGRLRLRVLRRPATRAVADGPVDLRTVDFEERVIDVPDALGKSTSFTDQTPFRRALLGDFADAILRGREPLVPGVEGLASLELANAMILSGFERRGVDLPLDAGEYQRFLDARVSEARVAAK